MHKIDLRKVDLNLLLVFDALMTQRSVTRAAADLGRTQSTISHALARLREQLGDPLMVKANGQMVASPFAEQLIAEVRLILSNIRRVLTPPKTFDARITTRGFSIALPDLSDSIFPMLSQRVCEQAPKATLEWVERDEKTYLRVAEGQIDLALIPSIQPLPEGVSSMEIAPLRWASFCRQGHPAADRWGKAAWSRWPHVAVRISPQVTSPVKGATQEAKVKRKVAVWVPNFSAVAPLLARTDLIATLPMLAMADRLELYGLQAMKTPFFIVPMPHRLIWGTRLGNDPAICWIRAHTASVLGDLLASADSVMPL